MLILHAEWTVDVCESATASCLAGSGETRARQCALGPVQNLEARRIPSMMAHVSKCVSSTEARKEKDDVQPAPGPGQATAC